MNKNLVPRSTLIKNYQTLTHWFQVQQIANLTHSQIYQYFCITNDNRCLNYSYVTLFSNE